MTDRFEIDDNEELRFTAGRIAYIKPTGSDEAHRLGGSTDQVARVKLGRALAEAAPYFLMLSATPHQGKTDAFRRILSLLDSDAFPDSKSIDKDRVAEYVIRTDKRRAIDADGLGGANARRAASPFQVAGTDTLQHLP